MYTVFLNPTEEYGALEAVKKRESDIASVKGESPSDAVRMAINILPHDEIGLYYTIRAIKE